MRWWRGHNVQDCTCDNPLLDKLFTPPTSTVGVQGCATHPLPVQIISDPGWYCVDTNFAYCARIYTTWLVTEGGGVIVWHRHYIAQGAHDLFEDVLLCEEMFTPLLLVVGDIRRNYKEGQQW